MGRKPKFRPKITRVKLNPEQAVLTCNCFSRGVIGVLPKTFSDVSYGTACEGERGRLGHIVGYDTGDPRFYGYTRTSANQVSS